MIAEGIIDIAARRNTSGAHEILSAAGFCNIQTMKSAAAFCRSCALRGGHAKRPGAARGRGPPGGSGRHDGVAELADHGGAIGILQLRRRGRDEMALQTLAALHQCDHVGLPDGLWLWRTKFQQLAEGLRGGFRRVGIDCGCPVRAFVDEPVGTITVKDRHELIGDGLASRQSAGRV